MIKRTPRTIFVIGVALALCGIYRLAQSSRARNPQSAAQSRARLSIVRALPNRAPLTPASLSGAVRDPQHRAVGGAEVCASCASCEPTSAARGPCVATGGDGRYAFSDLAPAGYYVTASANGFAPSSANAGQPVFVNAAEQRGDLDIEMKGTGAVLSGTTLDATGGAVAHARLRAVRIDEPRFVLETESDDSGRFGFDLAPGFVMLIAEADGYAPLRVGQTVPAANVELQLAPGSAIEGSVIEAASSAPLAGVRVSALPERARDQPIYQSAVSDAFGAFVIDGLEAGGYVLIAKAERHQGRLPDPIVVGLAEHVRGIEIALLRAAEVRGHVLEAQSEQPCRRGFVVLGPPSPIDSLAEAPPRGDDALGPQQVAAIESDGGVRFPGVPPGFYYVTIQCFDHVFKDGPRALRVRDAAQPDLTWHVSAGGRIRVAVVDANGQPVPRAGLRVRWPRPDPGRPAALMPAIADELGSYTLSSAPFGRYEVSPSQDNDGPSVIAEPTLRTPEVAVRLKLAGSATILVRLTNAAGVAIDNARVIAWPADERAAAGPGADRAAATSVLSGLALGAGRFRLGPLRAGRYVVRADDGINPPVYAGPPSAPSVQVIDGHVEQLTLVIQRGGSIRGRVRDEAGEPLANIWVTAVHETAPGSSWPQPKAMLPFGPRGGARALTDLAGAFRIDRLDSTAGTRFTLRAEQPGGASAVRRAVEPGAEVEIVLPALGSISGVALGTDDRPLRQAFSVRAFNPTTGSVREASFQSEDGRFEIKGIVPGALQLRAFTDSSASSELNVDLAPKQHLGAVQLALRAPSDSDEAPSDHPALAEP